MDKSASRMRASRQKRCQMHHELIPLSDPDRWRSALSGIPHAFGHTWESCYAMSLSTDHRTFLYQFESDDARIVCPIAERCCAGDVDIATPFGFSGFAGLGRSMEFPRAWLRFAREREWVCGYIGLNPLLECAEHYSTEDVFPQNELFYLELWRGESDLYRRLSKGRKHQIKTWNARRNWLCTDREALVDFVVAEANTFFQSRGASSVYTLTPGTWRNLLALQNVELMGATEDQRIVAVSIFAFSETVADLLFNISLPEGKNAAAALIWEGVLRLMTSRCSRTQHGRRSPPRGQHCPGEGTLWAARAAAKMPEAGLPSRSLR